MIEHSWRPPGVEAVPRPISGVRGTAPVFIFSKFCTGVCWNLGSVHRHEFQEKMTKRLNTKQSNRGVVRKGHIGTGS